MKRPLVLLAAVLACALAVGPAPRNPAGPASLVRIPKAPASTLSVLARLGIDVRQELGTCLLALADRTDLDLLRRSGVRFTVLERNADRREFLLVGTRQPGDLESLRAVGRAVPVEPGAAVFWTEAGQSAEAVPTGLPRKALAPRSILPYLRPRRAAVLPGAPASAQDPLVASIVALVSSSSLSAGVQTLQDFQTRYASTSNCDAAGEAIFASFSALGMDEVRFEPFGYTGGRTSRNVVAEKTGSTYPDDIVVICSHYDSISPSATRETLAPGADDNASGTAAVIEAARVLAPYDFDFSLRFIAFSSEEWGLWGSRAHAAAARAAGERILGVINLDMIAYTDVIPEDLQIIVNEDSSWLADLFAAAGPHYGFVNATKMVDASIVYSDHSPFWDNGYPALLAIEDYPLDNPYYHQTTDTLDKLNLDFLTVSTRASVGLLAELAQPVRDGYPRTPVGLAASTVVYSSLFNSLRAVRLTWTAQSDAATYNVYRTTYSHLGYVKLNGAPLAEPVFLDDAAAVNETYYYVVTAVGPAGLESNRSRELVLGTAASAAARAAALTAIAPAILRGPR
jgi:Peptidase family M28